jgi:MSHA biogenesis protein MshP
MMRRARGFTLPAAIFLLVILAALGAFALSLSTSQQVGAALDVQGTRAYQAARAGVQWGLFQAGCAGTTLTHAGTTLADFTTAVTCDETSANELGVTVTIRRIVATACNQPPCPSTAPGPNYVERQLVVTASR